MERTAMTIRIAIHQTYRVERAIAIDVEAASTAAACEALANGDIDIPAFDDSRWREARSLENEDYRRSEERRGGKACVSTCRSRWSQANYKKKNISKLYHKSQSI